MQSFGGTGREVVGVHVGVVAGRGRPRPPLPVRPAHSLAHRPGEPSTPSVRLTFMDYFFGTGDGEPTAWDSPADFDLNGDGTLDAVRLDFDGDGMLDDAMWDSDGDGTADRSVLDLDDDGTRESAFRDGGRGLWELAADGPAHASAPSHEAGPLGESESSSKPGSVETPKPAETSQPAPAPTPSADRLEVDSDGDGTADQVLIDSDGDGYADSSVVPQARR